MPLSLVSEGAAVLGSSHTSVLINHCRAQLRMHTRATTFMGQALLAGEGLETADCGIGTASNDMRATMTYRSMLTGTYAHTFTIGIHTGRV